MKQWLGMICLSFCMASYAADAVQTFSEITGAANAGLVQKRLQSQLPMPAQARPSAITEMEPKKTEATAAEAKIKFRLTHVSFIGNTVFSKDQLEAIFLPYYNKTISLVDLKNLVDSVTAKYRSAGYVLSRAILPPQTINNGAVKIQIIEGFISKINVEGNAGWNEKYLRLYSDTVLNERPLQLSHLERAMLLMNNLPGVSVKAVLTPSKKIPGSADLTLVTDRTSAAGYISYDNMGSRYIGPHEIGGGVTLYGKTLPGSSDTLRYMTVSRTSEMKYIEFMHTNVVGSRGTKLTVDANYTKTKPQFVLAPLDVIGKSQLIYVDLAYPSILSRIENFSVHTTATYNNVSSTILSQEFYNDLIRSLDIGGEYSRQDRWQGVNDVKLDFEKGFDILGAKQHVLQSRPKGVSDYFKLNLTISRLQALPWQLSFYAVANGQYAFEPLYATEQFAYGGPLWGRGYDPSEIVGDDGTAFTLELRRDTTYGMKLLSAIQYYVFYDAGIIWNRDGVNLPPKQSATSIGLGGRISFIKNLSGNVFYAKPLTHSINSQVLMGKDPFKPRIFFQIIASV